MPDDHIPHPIDYRGPQQARPVKSVYIESAGDRSWRRRRIAFRVGLLILVAPVFGFFARNVALFDRLGNSFTPDQFVQFAKGMESEVMAIKEYQRDTGHLPQTLDDLVPTYIPRYSYHPGEIHNGHFYCEIRDMLHQVISYDFTPGAEKWEVHGSYADGVIPLPPVTIGPTTEPYVMPPPPEI